MSDLLKLDATDQLSALAARRVSAQARELPHDPVTVILDAPTAARVVALATSVEPTPRDLVTVAVHRFRAAPVTTGRR